MEENILRKEKKKKKIQKKRYPRTATAWHGSAFTSGNQIIVECGDVQSLRNLHLMEVDVASDCKAAKQIQFTCNRCFLPKTSFSLLRGPAWLLNRFHAEATVGF